MGTVGRRGEGVAGCWTGPSKMGVWRTGYQVPVDVCMLQRVSEATGTKGIWDLHSLVKATTTCTR